MQIADSATTARSPRKGASRQTEYVTSFGVICGRPFDYCARYFVTNGGGFIR
jgi:hypothetical protein